MHSIAFTVFTDVTIRSAPLLSPGLHCFGCEFFASIDNTVSRKPTNVIFEQFTNKRKHFGGNAPIVAILVNDRLRIALAFCQVVLVA